MQEAAHNARLRDVYLENTRTVVGADDKRMGVVELSRALASLGATVNNGEVGAAASTQ